MRTLFLHVGLGKTGSSFIQACLANSMAALTRHGIEYYRGGEGPAVDWRISSGNGPLLSRDPVEAFHFAADKVLFSFEGLFGQLARHAAFRAKLRALCAAQAVAAVRILLFIRNPVAHAESCYQQDVKRGGLAIGPAQAFAKYRMPESVRHLLYRDLGLPDARFEVFNYDNHRDNLMPILARFLGVPPDCLAGEPTRPVNRSMTAAELRLLRALNRHLGAGSSFLSDALCHDLPAIAAERALPPLAVQQAMLDRLRPDLDAVNAKVPEAERYRDDLQDPAPEAAPLALSREQLDAIGDTVGRRIQMLTGNALAARVEAESLRAQLQLSAGNAEAAAASAARAGTVLTQLAKTGQAPERTERLGQQLERVSLRLP